MTMGKFYVTEDRTNSGRVRGYIATDDSTQDRAFGNHADAHAWADARNAGLDDVPKAGDHVLYKFHDSSGNDIELRGTVSSAEYLFTYASGVVWHIYIGNRWIGIHNIRRVLPKQLEAATAE